MTIKSRSSLPSPFSCLLAVLTLVFFGVGVAWAAEEVPVLLDTRPGVTQLFYFTAPSAHPVANLVLFAGADGKLAGYGPADIHHGNFLVRSRDLFVKQGFAVAVMDSPSDQPEGMRGFRTSKEHATDIAAVVAWLHKKNKAPVWLIGTSRGTISAANGAASVEGVAGLVLTSSITSAGRRDPSNVLNTDLESIRMPVLVVHNRDDACQYCTFSGAGDVLERLTHASPKELIAVEGGSEPESEPCEALSRHGYIGIEQQVVTLISDWIKRHQP